MEKDSNKSWDDAGKSALVAQIVSGKLSVKAACERHALSPETIQDWVRVFRRTTLQAFDEHLRQTFLIQGADAAALGSAEYTGTLDDIPIGDLIQTFQMGGKGGVISITRDADHSQIWCDKGEIIDAESGPLRGDLAVYRILGFEQGQVLADFHSEPRERTVELPGNVLLLEAARRKDESKRLLERLGDERVIYRPGQSPAGGSSRAERHVLALCDGGRCLREVLEQSEQGDLETLSALANLVERRQLVHHGVSLAPRSAPRAPSLAVALSSDTPHRGVSFLPLVATRRPEPARRKLSPIAFVAAGMALGSAIWMTASVLTRNALPVESPAPDAAAHGGGARSFQIDSSVEPRQAALWLDGVEVARGQLRRELPRDGTPHALRIVAPGYAPTTLLFVDAPPPAHIELEVLGPLPARETSARNASAPQGSDGLAAGAADARGGAAATAPQLAAPAAAAANAEAVAGALAGSPRAAGRRPAPAPRGRRAAAPTGKGSAERASSERDESAPATAAEAVSPRIQIIDDPKPVIQVIE